jgi:hypothetical protein
MPGHARAIESLFFPPWGSMLIQHIRQFLLECLNKSIFDLRLFP